MPKPLSLLKSVVVGSNVDTQEDILFTYLGGGMTISKSLFSNKTNFFKVEKSINNPNSKFKIRYTNEFPDLFGIQIRDFRHTLEDDGSSTFEWEVTDFLASDGDTFLNDLPAYTITLPVDPITNSALIPVDGVLVPVNTDIKSHIRYLMTYSENMTVEDRDKNFNLTSHVESFDSLIQSRNFSRSLSSKIKNSGQKKTIDSKFSKSTNVSAKPSNTTIDLTTGARSKLSGLSSYVTYVFIDDLQNSENPDDTRIVIESKIDTVGVSLDSVVKDGSSFPNIVNADNSLDLSISISSVLSNEDIVLIKLYDSPTLTTLLANIQDYSFDESIASITDIGPIRTITTKIPCSGIISGYQGPVTVYIQFKDVTWSPKNIYPTDIIYDITNEPSSIGGYEVVYVTNTDKTIGMRLNKFEHATNSPHLFTINAAPVYDINNIVSSVSLNDISVNNFNYDVILEDLIPETEYYVTFSVDDGINPLYTEFVSNILTDTDDVTGPVIDFKNIAGHTNYIHLNAQITDAKSPIDTIIYLAMTNDGYENNFKNKSFMDKKSIIQNLGEAIIPAPDTREIEIRQEISVAFIDDQDSNKVSIEPDNEYTVVVFSQDIIRDANNPTIDISNVTTYIPIEIISFEIVDTSRQITVNTTFNFGYPNVNVYCGIFETEPGTTYTNNITTMQWKENSDITESTTFDFTKTTEDNFILDNTNYFIALYVTSTYEDIAYAAYTNRMVYPYTKLDREGPVIHDVNVNFDNYA